MPASTIPTSHIDETTVLFMRGAGPIGYPGAAEVVNMRAPDYLLKRGIHSLPCIGDGRQSGTSGSPSILNASPEAAAGGGLAILRTGDRVRIDLGKGTADILVSDRGTGEAPHRTRGGGRLQISRPPDALAGNPAQHGRPDGNGRGARAGRALSEDRADYGYSKRQPLGRSMQTLRLRSFSGVFRASGAHVLEVRSAPVLEAVRYPTHRREFPSDLWQATER